jgi:hypothetical protein
MLTRDEAPGNGTRLVLWTCGTAANQRWQFDVTSFRVGRRGRCDSVAL